MYLLVEAEERVLKAVGVGVDLIGRSLGVFLAGDDAVSVDSEMEFRRNVEEGRHRAVGY